MSAATITYLVVGVVGVLLGALAIVFRDRYANWQNRVSKPTPGQEATPRLAIVTGVILVVVGFIIIGIGISGAIH